MIDVILDPRILAATLRIGTPLLLVAIGCAVCLKAGVFNIAVEGLMLFAALLAVVLATTLGDPLLGVGLTVLITTVVAFLFSVVTISLKADHIIAGLGLNMLALGFTSWVLESVLQMPGGYMDPRTPELPVVDIPILNQVPILGEMLAGQTIITYSSWLIAGLAYLFVHASKYGLRLRATGEHPVAATTVGIGIVFWQYVAVLISGALCGLAGASLSLSHLRLFTKGMTAGRGFISFTAASFAVGNIPGTVLVSLLFAFFGSLAIRLEGFGLPTKIVQMIPYLVTLVALILARRRIRT